jgi:hypothetical protein
MEKNYAGIDAILVSAWPEIQKDPELRRLAIRNMGEQPGPYRLARLVRGWANEKNLNPETEATYRQTIEQATGQPWDEALLSALDSEDFDAKGAAMEILHRQMDAATLRGRITALQGKSDTVLAIQYFLETFNYLPRGGEELTSSVVLYRVRRDMLPAAAKLALDWTKNYNYAFNIRDFHLLSRLTRDPLRNNLKRTQLVLDVGQAVKTRKHVEHTPDMPGGADDYEESFWLQVDNLTMADLWNLYLINEMLSRPRVQGSLRLMADADLADPNSAWGGLVFYQNGQAEAILYPPDPNAPANDLAYQPTPQLTTDGRDALCRFIGHFELLNNSLRAGPTAQELSDAATSNYYGLILTRTGENSFAAHYYNPRGNVVSLGRYPLQ